MRSVFFVSLLSLISSVTLTGCAGVESDIRRAEMREFFRNIVKGRDRGAAVYGASIADSTTEPQAGRYQYVPPGHLSHFMVERAVRGLASTQIKDADYLAFVVDRLFYVLSFDPTPAMRALTCEQLGLVLTGLPNPGAARPAKDLRADQRINNIAQDLRRFQELSDAGKKIKQSAVAKRLYELDAEAPPNYLSAMQMVRVLAAKPVAGAGPGPVREAAREIGPRVLRDAIVVALRDVGLGDSMRETLKPDEEPLVRQAAIRVLASVRATSVLDAAERRLGGDFYPEERDRDVRAAGMALLGELGRVDDPSLDPIAARAFDVCHTRLRDSFHGIRFLAHKALIRMTGHEGAPSYESWELWRAGRPSWQVPKTGAPEGADAPGPRDDSDKTDADDDA